MGKEILISHAGLKALEDELDELKTFKRKEIAEKIKIARGYGDLSENSEYDEAKNEQAKIEARIVEIEATLKNNQEKDPIIDVKDRVLARPYTLADFIGRMFLYGIIGLFFGLIGLKICYG